MIPKNTMILVESIRMTGKKLSREENGFLATVHLMAKANRLISDKQAKWLQDIYSKVTDGGNYQLREYSK